jgi:hypothetical protein
MKIPKMLSILLALMLTAVVFAPEARADNWNQKTELNFNQPVEVPGKVLPAGTYWFVLFDSPSDRNIVRIYDATNGNLDATLITAPTIRQKESYGTEIVLAERRHSQPEALWKWYYPGQLTGHEFLYPHHEQERLRENAKQIINNVPQLTVTDKTVS